MKRKLMNSQVQRLGEGDRGVLQQALNGVVLEGGLALLTKVEHCGVIKAGA
jgi:hypothetical protein